MTIKRLSITFLILAVLSVATWLIKRPAPPPGLDPRTGQPLVSRETLAAAREITIREGDRTVTLSTDETNGTWQVADYYGFPVDFSKLSSLASSLQSASVVRLVSRNPDRIERLDLGNAGIEIATGGALPAVRLAIGKTSEGGGRFIGFDTEEKAYLTDLTIQIDATAKNWALARLLDFKAEDVSGVDISFEDDAAHLVVKRDTAEADWKLASAQATGNVRSRELNNLLNRFTGLRFTDTDEPGSEESIAALDHSRSVIIELFDGTRYSIRIGRRPAPPVAPAEEGPEENSAATPPPAPKPGPVYVFVESNREDTPINQLMARRSFRISDYTFTSLPASADILIEPVPEPPPEPAPEPESAEEPAGGN
ncbi:MAG: DUF4340 domain-containing protein [Opitutaceae bacterium]